jgi:hypothetical protein
MFAKVLRLRLRHMGVLIRGSRLPSSEWAVGIFEMSRNGFGGPTTARRLVLRNVRANPDKGLLFELYQPMLVDVTDQCLRFRGVEGVPLGGGEIGGMVQEWLVQLQVASSGQ